SSYKYTAGTPTEWHYQYLDVDSVRGILEEYRSEAKGKLLAKYTYGYDPIAKQVQSAIHSGKIFEAYGSGGSVHLEYAYNSRGELTDVDALTGPGGARLPAHEF